MSTIGALIGLAISVILIVRKVSPVYSLMAGALLGGLLGGMSMVETVQVMAEGVKDVSPAIIRILSAGVLSGVLICTGAAVTLSNAIIRSMGERRVFLALALATMVLCAVGVFIDVAVITVAPIALAIGRRLNLSTSMLLLVMIGGGKCGNIISPNPNTIIAAENFGANLSLVMLVNLIPALIGLWFTVYIVTRLASFDSKLVPAAEEFSECKDLPSLKASLVTPLVTVLLLSMRPLLGIAIDPLIALPLGGMTGLICMKQWKRLSESVNYGLQKMSSVAILLVGTGTIAGIIKHSTIKELFLHTLQEMNLSEVLIAPVSGSLMSAATASSTAGATLASGSFADVVVAVGISAVWGAAMVNAGATVLDHLPHGSFFHATGGVCELNFKERMRLIPYETLIGAVLAASTTLLCILCN